MTTCCMAHGVCDYRTKYPSFLSSIPLATGLIVFGWIDAALDLPPRSRLDDPRPFVLAGGDFVCGLRHVR